MEDEPISSRLTKEVISKAFEATKSSVQFEQGNLVLIDEPQYGMALKFLKLELFPDEPLSQAAGIEWCQELEDMCVLTLRANLSFMLVDPETKDVMGMRMMRVLKRGEKLEIKDIENIPFRKMITFFEFMEEKVNFFQRYDVTEAISFFGLGVGKKYRKRGIGSRLIDVAIKFVENMGISPICIKCEGSSMFSKKIFEKANLDFLFEVGFDECKENGEVLLTGDTGENKSVKAYGKRLNVNVD